MVGTKHIPDSEQRSVQPCSADYFHCAPAGGYFTQPRPLRLPGLFFGVAELLQIAAVAFGFAGVADLAAVVDDLVGEADPAALGDDSHQLLLDFLGRVALGQAEAAADAEDVRIDYNAFGFAETDAEDDVGGFAGRSGDRNQLGESLRNLVAEVFDQLAGCAMDGFGLVVEEAGGAYEGFEFRQSGFGHSGRGREAAEQLRGHHVDAHVRALCGEDGGDQEFPGRAMEEGALDVGIGFVEGFEDGGDAAGGEVAARGCLGCGFSGWFGYSHWVGFRRFEIRGFERKAAS